MDEVMQVASLRLATCITSSINANQRRNLHIGVVRIYLSLERKQCNIYIWVSQKLLNRRILVIKIFSINIIQC